jgi:RNA recognition motif-containing protein
MWQANRIFPQFFYYYKSNSMNLYVSNLMSNILEDDLYSVFAPYGDIISCKIVKDKFTGVSRGFAFVEMHNEEAGNNAISALDQKDINGRNISVSVARERTNTFRPGGDRDRDRRHY